MAGWRPDWRELMANAPEHGLDGEDGFVYLVADPHLDDRRAPPQAFLAMLEGLERARLIVLLGDLFRVWLALPKFWNQGSLSLLAGLRRIRERGTPLWFVVGNRELFLPRDAGSAAARELPFDAIIHDVGVLRWAGRRYGLTHGDLVNREDARYLKWRRLCRGSALEAVFRAMPGALARRVAEALERSLANTNQEIKVSYPRAELEAFAETVLEGLDGFFIGHFHCEETLTPPGSQASLRIVPDWFSMRRVLRLHPDGKVETLGFPPAGPD